jgi:hypothetical protein
MRLVRPSVQGTIAALLCVCFLAATLPCWALSTSATPIEAADVAETVFVGEVVEIETTWNWIRWAVAGFKNLFAGPSKRHLGSLQLYLITFQVTETLKGPASEKIVVLTYGPNEMCGLSVETGQTYLVYAYHGRGDELVASPCGRTTVLDEETDELQELRAHYRD